MRKLDNCTPDIFINRISIDKNDYLEIFIDTPTGSDQRTPKMLRLKDGLEEFSQLELTFEGFEGLNKNTYGQEILSGFIYLILKSESAHEKILLASPDLTVSKYKQGYKRNKVSNTANFNELVKELKKEWQFAFSEALDNASPVQQLAAPHNSSQYKKKNKSPIYFENSNIFSSIVKIIIVVLLLSGVAYLGLTAYGKALQVETTRNTALSLNPSALAKNQKDVVDETFKEIGIDRSKLTSDLSCFAEE